jgi:hypothetical protein
MMIDVICGKQHRIVNYKRRMYQAAIRHSSLKQGKYSRQAKGEGRGVTGHLTQIMTLGRNSP